MRYVKLLSLMLSFALLVSCGSASEKEEAQGGFVDAAVIEIELEDEAVAMAEAPVPVVTSQLKLAATGDLQKKNTSAVIDYSHVKDGYVMVQYTAQTTNRLKVQVKGPSTTYTYNLTAGKWEVFPLSDGNGKYTVAVYKNVSGTRYASVLSLTQEVTLSDEFGPFLYSNQYVDYAAAPETVAKAEELLKDVEKPLERVAAIYQFVVKNLAYDKTKAATVKSGYLPVLDDVLKEKKGICFDYAALMAGMLRSQGIPCKLVVGYAGSAYHAWISVWSEETGWINGAIYFDGSAWHRMDPTFASSAKESASIMAYIGDGENYTAKYLY